MFEDRYPELSFMCQYLPKEAVSLLEELPPMTIGDVELIYVYGLGHYFEQFEQWLSENPERDLVIIEDQLGMIEHFKEETWLLNPQVHLVTPFDHAVTDRQFCRELASRFPVQKIEIFGLPSRNLQPFALELKRMATLAHGRFCEHFYHHRIFDNLLPNFKRMQNAFLVSKMRGIFAGRPAVVCGAGPSLEGVIDDLKKHRNEVLIIAGGSAIAALSNQGIQPHIGIAIDPNQEEYPRIKASTAFTIPLIMGARVLPDIFNTTSGDIGYLQSIACDTTEYWVSEQLGIHGDLLESSFGEEAMSVTTTCIALAEFFGCDPIMLAGVDLAYSGMEHYAKGVFSDSRIALKEKKAERRARDTLIEAVGIDGQPIYTAVRWVMESAAISRFAENTKSRIVNISDRGLGFENVENVPFLKILLQSNVKPFYMDGFLHAKMEDARAQVSDEQMDETLTTLQKSVKNCEKILAELLEILDRDKEVEDHPLITLLDLDLQKEIAFTCLLQGIAPALWFVINRKERGTGFQAQWSKKRAFYAQILERVRSVLDSFDMCL